MRAITIPSFGDADVLHFGNQPDPIPGVGEVLIEVAAAGVNRADIGQREGNYPPPAGASALPGMEVSGVIIGLGPDVPDREKRGSPDSWAVGDRVAALLPGGGYASRATAAIGQLLPVPDSVDLIDAAGLPEAVATVWSTVFMSAALKEGELLLVHGGSSGIGTMAIQMAHVLGSRVAVTAGSAAKLAACAGLGADLLINYRTEDFVEAVLTATGGNGCNVILDAIGGSYLDRNLRALAPHGRLESLANLSGEQATLNFGLMMRKWLSVHGSTLRARPLAEKNTILDSVRRSVWPLVESGRITPVIDRRFALSEAADAHRRMESSEHIGKLLLLP